MNFDLLDKVIPRRCLADDAGLPRAKLNECFRTLECLREARDTSTMSEAELASLEKQIQFYERIFE